MEQKFKAGEEVKLRSGSPSMTVVDYGQYGHIVEKSYKCKWWDAKTNRFIEDTFTEPELVLAQSLKAGDALRASGPFPKSWMA